MIGLVLVEEVDEGDEGEEGEEGEREEEGEGDGEEDAEAEVEECRERGDEAAEVKEMDKDGFEDEVDEDEAKAVVGTSASALAFGEVCSSFCSDDDESSFLFCFPLFFLSLSSFSCSFSSSLSSSLLFFLRFFNSSMRCLSLFPSSASNSTNVSAFARCTGTVSFASRCSFSSSSFQRLASFPSSPLAI